jgi:hypothetical protein
MRMSGHSEPRQLALALDDGPVWSAAALEAALYHGSGQALRLTLTDNRSVLLSFSRRAGRVLVRLHRMFLHAPTDVVAGLARAVRRRGRVTDSVVRRFMNENLFRVRHVPRRLPVIEPRGRAYDLSLVFARLNAQFFSGALRVPVTWGRGGSGRARRGGLTFGSYDPVLRLIRIHPVLDRPEVPEFFLESVLHHEMLHHRMGGVADRGGRTVYHTRAFREAEARYPRHAEALAWEKAHLPYLLRASQELRRR